MKPVMLATVRSFAAALAVTMLASSSFALPRLGAPRPDAVIADAWDRTFELSRFTGMPMLVVYEDKDSAAINQAFKAELAKLAAGDSYKKRVALVAVADVSGYDYWPVRGFVKDAIKEESQKQGTLIYCDWDGSFRAKLRLHRATSNVVLFGKGGKVLFAHAGVLDAKQLREVLDLLRREVDG